MYQLKSLRSVIKPTVLFDPADRTHRQHFHNFLTTGSWSESPVWFQPGSPTTDIPLVAMKKQLADFYLNREFA